jgi:hypothetical protein
MRPMSTTAPPIVPPTMAPKSVEGAGVLVEDGVLVELLVVEVLVGRLELVEGVGERLGVTESEVGVGVLVANAPIPVSTGVGIGEGVVITILAAELNELYMAWLGGLITPTIPTLQ